MRTGRFHYSTIELLGALVLLLVLLPFLEDIRYGQLIEVLLLTLVFVSAVFAVGAQRSAAWMAGILMVLALAAKCADYFLAPAFPLWVFPPLAICFLGFVIIHLVRSTLQASQVDARVLCAAVAAYLILGLLFAIAYILVGRVLPGAFSFGTGPESSHAMNRFNAYYFSFVTLSTVGYGDISPVAKVARMLAATEAMTGMLYMAVLIARLVSLYSSSNPQVSDQE
jgi:Ion channel